MRLFASVVAAALCLVSSCADAAGLRLVQVPVDGAPPMQIAVWSPCATPAGEVKIRTLTLPGTADCPVLGDKLPLIMVSHGYGGSFTGHHDTAETLADAGFVVVAVNHPVDTGSGDMTRADTLAVLVERSADIKRAIDYMLGAWPDHARLDPGRIGFFGFSRGGYTGLVVAGANPDIRKATAFCPEGNRLPSCEELQRNKLPAEPAVHDPRVKAMVVADPAFGPLFDRDALKDVKIPVQLWASELSGEDHITEINPGYVAAINDELPVKPDYHVVRNAGHFAFLVPCSADLAQRRPKICTDPPGFDRVAFHKEWNARIVTFFREHLIEDRQP
ncbi:dienelactone hydrolase family protein [Bradyrhizobium genosp. L]|uniref:alpha/beta hydrolase family protein n=1 Tax=Bradyrhizobium genosp. L TaxID=83637 RepID=UPI0018A3324C|nr:dienelactone hydrolase family protein [Bradyrhizobium genosp. L]QPF87164.1 dienelactone hydrolase family protein [Bradyrhizobium genosp. L]